MKKKMFFCVIVIITLTLMFSSIVFADDAASVIGKLNNNASSDTGVLDGPATAIIGLIKYIAIAVALGMIIIIGMKWMTSGAGGKATIKDTLLPYLIGAICVGAASAIAVFALGLGGG